MNELSISENNYLIVKCEFAERSIVKQIGGIFDKRLKAWLMPLTSINVSYLLDNLPNITLSDDFEEKVKKIIEKEERLEKIKKLAKSDKPIQFKVPYLKEGTQLHNYQKLGVLFTLTTENGVLLADDVGLGKSIQSISAAVYNKYKKGIKNCLVVTLASLKWNYPLEIKKFTNESYVVIDGTPEERIRQWNEKAFFYVTNYETIVEDLFGGKNHEPTIDDDDAQIAKKLKKKEKCEERYAKLENVRNKIWDMIIFDEAHAMKSHDSKRSRACKQLKAYFKMGLTGTPMDGRLEELHSVFECLLPGLFESKTSFLQKHATFDWHGKITGYKNIGVVKKKIQPFFLRRMKEEVLKDLPPKIYINRYITMDKKQKKLYDEIANRSHEITQDDEAMVAILRAKQLCDHPRLIGLDEESCKLESFKELIDELVVQNKKKVIIFSQYSKMCEILIETLKEMGLKYLYICGDVDKKLRVDMQTQFNSDPLIDVIIGTDAMSTGLNLTGASDVINYDDYWSPSTMDQRSGRAHRLGQKDTVNVYNFIIKDTIEERVRDVVYNKSKISADVLGDNVEDTVLQRLGPKDLVKLI